MPDFCGPSDLDGLSISSCWRGAGNIQERIRFHVKPTCWHDMVSTLRLRHNYKVRLIPFLHPQ